MSASQVTTFSDRLYAALEEAQATVFPERRHYSEAAPLTFWHEIATQDQQAELEEQGVSEAERTNASACGRVNALHVELPRKIRRDTSPRLCPICVRKGELGRDGMLEEAIAVIRIAHEAQELATGQRR